MAENYEVIETGNTEVVYDNGNGRKKVDMRSFGLGGAAVGGTGLALAWFAFKRLKKKVIDTEIAAFKKSIVDAAEKQGFKAEWLEELKEETKEKKEKKK